MHHTLTLSRVNRRLRKSKTSPPTTEGTPLAQATPVNVANNEPPHLAATASLPPGLFGPPVSGGYGPPPGVGFISGNSRVTGPSGNAGWGFPPHF